MLEFDWKAQGIHHFECKECDRIMDNLTDSKIITTSLGKAVVVSRLELVDTRPEVLAAGLPILLEDELARFGTEPPAQRKKLWDARATACDEYRALKAANPAANIDTPFEAQP